MKLSRITYTDAHNDLRHRRSYRRSCCKINFISLYFNKKTRQKKNYRRKIIGGFFGNIFTTIAENIPGIACKVAPIAIDAGKGFATGAASAAGTAVGQKIADKIIGSPQSGPVAPVVAATATPSESEIKQAIVDIAPTKETRRAMVTITKKLLSPRGDEIVRKLVSKTKKF